MLPGLQYTDFHKFLVSVGGLMAVVGLALPVFLLRSQPTLLIAQQQLRQATPDAQKAVRSQQDQLAVLILSWPWISGGLIAAGSILVALGARAWRKQQARLDSREQAEVSKLLAEGEKAQQETLALVKANQASPGELAEQEAEREEATQDSEQIALVPEPREPLSEERPTDFDPDLRPRYSLTLRRTYDAAVRRTIIAMFDGWFRGKGTAVPDVKLGSGRYASRVFVSNDETVPNMLLEIRFISPSSPRRIADAVQEMAGWALAAANKADEMFKSQFVPVAVLAYEPAKSELALPSSQPTLPLMPPAADAEMDYNEIRTIIASEVHAFHNYPVPLVILVVNKRAIDVSPLAKITRTMPNGVHVV